MLERRVRPGAEAVFETWTKALVDSAARSRALEGSTVLATVGGDYLILLRFASERELERWQSAPETQAMLASGDRHSEAVDRVVRTGFETWFALPGRSIPSRPPPEWKMALVTWVALYPLVAVLVPVVPAGVPFLLNVALTTAIPLVLLTWVVMPRLTKLLYGWLYAPEPARAGGASRPVAARSR
ncbi:MAG: hypothetical protein R2909_19100 [Gemmatimonadales bacterium]